MLVLYINFDSTSSSAWSKLYLYATVFCNYRFDYAFDETVSNQTVYRLVGVHVYCMNAMMCMCIA